MSSSKRKRQPDFQCLGRHSELVLRTIKQDIIAGKYPVGSRLPTEHELCRTFGVSRPTVRRAIARLAEEGLVNARQGAGTFAAATMPEPVSTAGNVIAAMSPIHTRWIQLLQDLLMQRNMLAYHYFQSPNQWNPAQERVFLTKLIKQRPRALIAFCSPVEPRNDDILAKLQAVGTKVVHLVPFREKLPDEDYVIPDFQQAGTLAASSLCMSGYEHLKFVQTDMAAPSSQLILKGIRQVYDIKRNAKDIFFAFPSAIEKKTSARRELCKSLRKLRHNTGLVVGTNYLGQWIIKEMRDLGRKIPEEFGIVTISSTDEQDTGTDRDFTLFNKAKIDTLRFSYEECLRRALTAIFAESPSPIRELLPPKPLHLFSTTRSPGER